MSVSMVSKVKLSHFLNLKIKIMKTINTYVLSAMLITFLTFNLETFAQVSIGSITPDVSSMLDITSSTKGMLAPRMTTV